MKILVADKLLTNPDFDTEPRREGIAKLEELAEVEAYSVGEFTANEADAVVGIIADSALFHPEFYEAAKDLRIIARWGVGFENVNVEIATERGVIITVAPEHMTTVAEYTIAQWMATLKRVYTLNRIAHEGDHSIIKTHEAEGSSLGLYGFGRIGQAVAERAKPLLGESGELLVYDIRPDIQEVAAKSGAQAVKDPIELFEKCDTISLHVAGDDPIVSYEKLCAMKPHASLINPSRGNLVVDADVNRAIEEGRLFYYVVDDPTNGPREIHRGNPQIICTNHNAGMTVESGIRLDLRTFGQVTDAIQGRKPAHVLNPEVLDHPRVQGFLTA